MTNRIIPGWLVPGGLLEQLEARHVDNARAHGWSWEAIATVLGVRRQSVHKKHAADTGADDVRQVLPRGAGRCGPGQ